MLQNYFKIAWRNLIRRRFYTLGTLFGLTVALTFLLLIGSYIQTELAVNQTIRHVDQHYMLKSRWRVKEMGYEMGTLAPLGPTLKHLYPTLVANYYRTYGVGAIVSVGQHHFREQIQIGDSTLIAMFGLPIAHGDPLRALTEPNSVVITASLAQKYFGQTNVLRRQLTIQTPTAGKQVFTITGVLDELPENTVTHLGDFKPQLFIPIRRIGYFIDQTQMDSWENRTIITYLELKDGISPSQLDTPFQQTLKTYTSRETQANLQAYLSPLKTFYLKSNNGFMEKMLFMLAIVALFILLMAVVNAVNISLGMSVSRLQEIGVRRVLGGLKIQLIGQFLAEAFLVSIGAMLLAVTGQEIFRPAFSEIVEKKLPSIITWSPTAFVSLVVLLVMIGLMTGFYPAFILSRQPVADAVKGKLASSVQKGKWGRQVLIAFQFSVAIFVFTAALVIRQQVAFLFSKELGYQKNQILTISSVPRDWSAAGVQRMEVSRNQLARIPGVHQVSLSYEIPDGGSSMNIKLFPQGGDSTLAITAVSLTTDEQYAQTYGLKMKAGQFFHQNARGYDSTRVVLNESAVKALGWENPQQVVGQFVHFWGGSYQVQGIVTDYHSGSLREKIEPTVFLQIRRNPIYRYFSVRIKADHLSKTLAALEQKWRELFPEAPFDYLFMDQTLQNMYRTERQLQKSSQLATVLSVSIVLSGVMGLVSLSVTRRTKEIGIRRVLGASPVGIITLFLGEFILILLLAGLIAFPTAYFFLDRWLAAFAYRSDWSWRPFVVVFVSLVGLTCFIISIRTIKAALSNPVHSLRTE